MDLETESRLGVARAWGGGPKGYEFSFGVLKILGLESGDGCTACESGDGCNTTELYTLNG